MLACVASRLHLTHRWLASVGLQEGMAATLILHLQETLGVFVLLLCQLRGEMAHALQSHIGAVEKDAQREVGVRGPRT